MVIALCLVIVLIHACIFQLSLRSCVLAVSVLFSNLFHFLKVLCLTPYKNNSGFRSLLKVITIYLILCLFVWFVLFYPLQILYMNVVVPHTKQASVVIQSKEPHLYALHYLTIYLAKYFQDCKHNSIDNMKCLND